MSLEGSSRRISTAICVPDWIGYYTAAAEERSSITDATSNLSCLCLSSLMMSVTVL